MRLTAIVLSALALLAQSANATTRTAQIKDYQRKTEALISATWQRERAMGMPLTPTTRSYRRATSVGYVGWVYRYWKRTNWRVLQRYKHFHWLPTGTVPQIIEAVFREDPRGALNVASCESHYSTTAANGQYLGIFQMGSSERAHYATIGYATAYEQVVAAHNYYLVSGWGPWSCRP